MAKNGLNTIVLLLLILPLLGPARADQIEVVAFVYEPYIFADDRGLASDILISALESVGHSVRINYYPRKRAIQNFLDGEGDLFVGTRSYFPSESFESQEVFFYRRGLVHRNIHSDTRLPESLAEFNGENIAIRLGSSKTSDFDEAGAKITNVPDSTNGLQMLDLGRVDFVYALDLEAQHILQQLVPDRIDDFFFMELETNTCDVIQRADSGASDYLSDLRLGLKNIIDKGKYRSIFETYYGIGRIPDSVMLSGAIQ